MKYVPVGQQLERGPVGPHAPLHFPLSCLKKCHGNSLVMVEVLLLAPIFLMILFSTSVTVPQGSSDPYPNIRA